MRPFKPNPVPLARCAVCGGAYPTREPDEGCYSPVAVPVAVMVAEGRCETCIRRGLREAS